MKEQHEDQQVHIKEEEKDWRRRGEKSICKMRTVWRPCPWSFSPCLLISRGLWCNFISQWAIPRGCRKLGCQVHNQDFDYYIKLIKNTKRKSSNTKETNAKDPSDKNWRASVQDLKTSGYNLVNLNLLL